MFSTSVFYRKRFVLTGFFVIIFSFCFGQQTTVTLTGKVIDEKTGKPLPFANVFVNNTTIGTNADENGNYKLPNLAIGNLEMGVSFLGYETVKQTLRFEQPGVKTVVFKLREGMELQGVTIRSGKNKKREKNLKIITRELLGNSRFAKQCKILNTEVLRIYDDDDGHLGAQTTAPLVIENNAMGYRIFQDLDDFDFNLESGKLYYGGATRFELLKAKDNAQRNLWRSNQKESYGGSLKHLLTSMVTDSLHENGFKVYQEIPDSIRIFGSRGANSYGYNPISNHLHIRIEQVRGEMLIKPAELETERVMISGTPLEVFYTKKRGRSQYTDMPYAYTKITLPQGYIIITPTGWVVMPMGFEVAGDLGNNRFANLLPADWKRDE